MKRLQKLLAPIFLLLVCSFFLHPAGEDPEALPEICLVVPMRFNSPGWVDFGDVDGDGDNDIIISHWQLPDRGSAIEVWRNNGPGNRPALIWYDTWHDPQAFLSYPEIPWEQGPLVAGNFKGGDAGKVEIAFRYHKAGRYFLRLVSGADGLLISQISLREPVADILAVNMSHRRGSRFSDLLAATREHGKLTRRISCYKLPSLARRWSFTIGKQNDFDPRQTCHRVLPIPWPNGKDVVWYGGGLLDWNGGGCLGRESYAGKNIPLLDPGSRQDYNVHHWDSCAFFLQDPEPPVLLATTCSRRVWRFPGLTSRSMQGQGRTARCWEYRWDKVLDAPETHHIHRLRPLDARLLLFSDVYGPDGYRAGVMNRDTMHIKWIEQITAQEAERIEWDADQSKWEILTETGIYDFKLRKISERKGKLFQENNIICDLWGTGHQQYGYTRRNQDRWEIVFVANPGASRSKPVPVDVNHHFY